MPVLETNRRIFVYSCRHRLQFMSKHFPCKCTERRDIHTDSHTHTCMNFQTMAVQIVKSHFYYRPNQAYQITNRPISSLFQSPFDTSYSHLSITLFVQHFIRHTCLFTQTVRSIMYKIASIPIKQLDSI